MYITVFQKAGVCQILLIFSSNTEKQMCKKEKGRGGKVCLRGKKVGGRNLTSMAFERFLKERESNKKRRKTVKVTFFHFTNYLCIATVDSKISNTTSN